MVHLSLRPLERSRRQATTNNKQQQQQRQLQYTTEAFRSECKQRRAERSGQNYHRRPIFTIGAPRQTATAAAAAREATGGANNQDNSNSISRSADVVTCDSVRAAHAPESLGWSSSGKRRQVSAPLVSAGLGVGLAQRATIMLLALIAACSPGRTRASAGRMVRLCIASVEPAKLSSQCVMCNRREFPLTVIDCTGITKVNDLVANPLSVQEAACLIYNCRRQVPNIMPEPYHGAISHAARVNGHHYGGGEPSVSGSGMHNYQDSAMMQSPQLSSPTSTSMAMLSPASMPLPLSMSLANLFGGLPSPLPPSLFSGATYAAQPSMAGYYAAGGGFYAPSQQQQQQQQQLYGQQQQLTASSVPYSMRYGAPFAATGSGNYNVVPVQFVQQSGGPYGPLTAAVMGAASHGRGPLSNLVHGRGSTMVPMSVAAWPQSLSAAGANGFVYDAAAAHPSMTAVPSPAFVGQPSAMAMMMSPHQQQPQSPYSTMMMSSAASSAPASAVARSSR